MKTSLLILAIALSFSPIKAQNTNTATKLMEQGKASLEKNEYKKARNYFANAYNAFAAQGDYKQAILCGVEVNSLMLRNRELKEGFAFCRDMDVLIWTGEQKLKKSLYDLRFLVTKERLEMFTALKNVPKAKEQLAKLEEAGNLAKNDSLNNVLLYAKANFYFTFGPAEKGISSFNRLIEQYKKDGNLEKVAECYKSIIDLAGKANNATAACKAYEKYIVWSDSVKALAANKELKELKVKYDTVEKTLEEKDSELSARQYKIIALCALALILIVALVVLGIILLRYMRVSYKLKKGINIANEHSQLKSKFIENISSQMEPTLDVLTASIGKNPEELQANVHALRKFCSDIQELSYLENTLTEPYEVKEVNANSLCEKVMDDIKVNLQPGVTTTVNAPKLQVKTNPEQLERILIHLLNNAAYFTKEGKINLDFKKRGAHIHQFIVTDTGESIPAEQQENIFKPFTEVKDLTQGDGLGLPICSLIATKMNGSLTLDTTYTKGCRFILELHG